MPRFDGTGPEGAGPLTGWGDGECTDENVENEVQDVGAAVCGRPMRRRATLLRRRWSRLGRRGRGRGPGRGRRGAW